MRIADDAARQTPEGAVALINIVFLLLVFFLLAGSLQPRADRDIAYAETQDSPAERPQEAALYVDADGGMSYDGEAVMLDGLAGRIGKRAGRPTEDSIPVIADRALEGEALAELFAALAEAGIERVRLVTVRGERP